MSWISPTGHSDPDSKWYSESNAYDDDTGTYAFVSVPKGTYSAFLHLTHAGVTATKIRYMARHGADPPSIDAIDVDVYKDSAWEHVYEGDFVDLTWEEHSFTEGNVTEARIRFHEDGTQSRVAFLYEFDFYGTVGAPPALASKRMLSGLGRMMRNVILEVVEKKRGEKDLDSLDGRELGYFWGC